MQTEVIMDYNERTRLLIDDEKLTSGTVIVFGLGGVGSFVAEALVRMGVGHLIICDNDTVNVSNINRQLIALHSTVGRKKVDVARERYLDINPELDIRTLDTFILPENAGAVFDALDVDYVADCIDTVSGKLAIITECKKRNIPVISCMGTGNKLHPEMFRITDIKKTSVCPLCRVMRRELKSLGIDDLPVLFSTEEPLKMESGRPAANRNAEDRNAEGRNAESRNAEGRNAEDRNAENWNAEGRNAEDRNAEGQDAAGRNDTMINQHRVIGSIATVPSVAGLMIADFIAKELVK